MKKFLIIVGLALLVFVSYHQIPTVRHLLSYSPCNTPLTYRIGSIDSRFQLTTDEVKQDAKEAADSWNSSMGKPIFMYHPEGKVTINLIYDQRQQLSSQVNQLQEQLATNKTALDPQIQSYNQRSQAFDQKASALNQQIQYWNSQGGAPDGEYQKLIQEQKELQIEADQLNTLARSLNQSARDYNLQIGELNQTEKQLNQTLVTKPEEGLWNGYDNTIAIYFNNSRNELIHTLSHELGHARGLDHNSDPNSIMYPSSTEVISPSTADLADLTEVCKERSDLEMIIQGYTTFIHQLENKFQSTQITSR